MKKVIRLTESDLVNLVTRVVNESEVGENFGFLRKILSPKTSQKTTMGVVKRMTPEIDAIFRKLPDSLKVGPRLSGLFKNNMTRIKNLKGNISRGLSSNPKLGVADSLVSQLERKLATPQGTPIDVKSLYQTSLSLKKELEQVKRAMPKPNINDKKKLDQWYNYLYSESADINKFVSELEEVIKTAK
jgi:hypothetical protein